MPLQKILLFLMGIILSIPLYSQKKIPKDELALRELTFKTNSLKYYLSDLVNPFAPAFQLAYERRFSRKFAAELSAGYITSFGGQWGANNQMEGYLLRAEAGTLAIT